MSKQFQVTTIFYSNEPINDFPAKTVWAKDKQGEWYYYVGWEGGAPKPIDEERVFSSKACWPKTLYRNYWKHIGVKGSETAVYFDNIRNASFTTIK